MTVDFEHKTAELLVEGIFTNEDVAEYQAYLSKVMEIVLLVQLLENNGIMMVYHKHGGVLLLTTNDNSPRIRTTLYNFPDNQLKRYVLDTFGKTIIINEEFRSFCKNGFLTRDESRERRNASIANKAFWISVLAIFISLLALANDLEYIPRKSELKAILDSYSGKKGDITNDSLSLPKPPELHPKYN